MLSQVLRSALLAGAASAMGMRAAAKLERQLAGGRAMSTRAHMAHRALMAILFRYVKKDARHRVEAQPQRIQASG